MVLGGVATAIYVLPPVLLSLPILLIFFLRSRKVFVCSSREIKRLEGLARSPIFDSIAESLSGVATIRTNDAVPYFRAKFEDAQNAHSRAFFAFIYSSRYLGVRIDCLMFAVIFISSYLAIILKETGKNFFLHSLPL
jgi:ATP-binding cassette subfamily C (CFTR/MRP) protein 4